MLPGKNVKPLGSFNTKKNIQKEIRKLERDINYKENVLADSFGSSRGDGFWDDNNLSTRLNDSRKEAFRNLKREFESKINPGEFTKNKDNKKASSNSLSLIHI